MLPVSFKAGPFRTVCTSFGLSFRKSLKAAVTKPKIRLKKVPKESVPMLDGTAHCVNHVGQALLGPFTKAATETKSNQLIEWSKCLI